MMSMTIGRRGLSTLREACDMDGIAWDGLDAVAMMKALMQLGPPVQPDMALQKKTSPSVPSMEVGCHDKRDFTMAQLAEMKPLKREDATAEVGRQWDVKKRKLLDGSELALDETDVEQYAEACRKGWRLYLVDDAIRYYRPPIQVAAVNGVGIA